MRGRIIGVLRRTPLWGMARVVFRWAVGLLPALGVRQSDESLRAQANDYWTNLADDPYALRMTHSRGDAGIADAVFRTLGRENVERYERSATGLVAGRDDLRILEWGCGGGSNLVAFADHAAQLIGVDVDTTALAAAGQELASVGVTDFQPIHITVEDPEAAEASVDGHVDLFLCLYVFEVLPGNAYAERILRIANRVLRPGGTALVQIKYPSGHSRSRAHKAFYKLNIVNMTAFGIPEFWELSERLGFDPTVIDVQPVQALTGSRNYAYFRLVKPAA